MVIGAHVPRPPCFTGCARAKWSVMRLDLAHGSRIRTTRRSSCRSTYGGAGSSESHTRGFPAHDRVRWTNQVSPPAGRTIASILRPAPARYRVGDQPQPPPDLVLAATTWAR